MKAIHFGEKLLDLGVYKVQSFRIRFNSLCQMQFNTETLKKKRSPSTCQKIEPEKSGFVFHRQPGVLFRESSSLAQRLEIIFSTRDRLKKNYWLSSQVCDRIRTFYAA